MTKGEMFVGTMVVLIIAMTFGAIVFGLSIAHHEGTERVKACVSAGGDWNEEGNRDSGAQCILRRD